MEGGFQRHHQGNQRKNKHTHSQKRSKRQIEKTQNTKGSSSSHHQSSIQNNNVLAQQLHLQKQKFKCQSDSNRKFLLKVTELEEGDCSIKPYSSRSQITYKIKGSKISKYSSENIIDLTKNYIRKEIIDSSEKQESQEYQETKKRKRKRYFDDDTDKEYLKTNVCYKCGENGHYARHCSIRLQAMQRCIFCLNRHKGLQCEEIICKKCSKQGHTEENCYSIGEECLKCQKIGHDKMNCGCIVFLDEKIYEVDSDFPSRVNKQEKDVIKCLTCGDEDCGNFNCFDYREVENIYEKLITKK